jgi:uncharacterized membrane protein
VIIRSEKENLEKEFHVSWFIIAYKFLFGLTEFVAGSSLALFGRQLLNAYTVNVAKELSQDPHDLLASLSEKIVANIFSHNTFIIIYLIILGGVKMVGAAGLVYKKNWGVDLIVGLITILLPFQIIDLIINPSLFTFLYMLTGIFIGLYLVEYKPKAWISKKVDKILNLKS